MDQPSIYLIFHSLSTKRSILIILCLAFKRNQSRVVVLSGRCTASHSPWLLPTIGKLDISTIYCRYIYSLEHGLVMAVCVCK